MTVLITSSVSATSSGYRDFTASNQANVQAKGGESAGKTAGKTNGSAALAKDDLDSQELSTVVQLQTRDREVRAHEQAHLAAAGGLAVSGATFEYQTGPDGRRYAVGGEVRIDTSPGRDAEETIVKAERIRAAALAPADPSPQDRTVAAEASQMASEARVELARTQVENQTGTQGSAATDNSTSTTTAAEETNEEGFRWNTYPAMQNSTTGGSAFRLGASVDIYA